MSAVPDAPAVGESAVSASTLLRTRNLNPYNLTDWAGKPLNPLDPLLTRCRAALDRKEQRAEGSLPPLYIDPLSPLPLADAAEPAPAVHFVFFLMASRSYAHETINRNVHALQHPGALTTPGTNESNLFLIHVDAKMSSADRANLRANVRTGPDVYFIRRPRYVMWAGVSMTFALHDAMASLIARRLHFEYVINLSDADLTLRTDGELRSFFGRYRGRTIMSIVPKHRDPRRYKQHENFRRFCWTECDEGAGWVVASPKGESLSSFKVIGKRKCCWSRSAPIVYTDQTLKCANKQLPEVYHGSQWVSLHRSMVHHLVRHPTAKRVLGGFERTLLPDEALLQTMAVNSPLRKTIIASHMRFIEWPQLHGDANAYWASLGPRFHGGPMVLNVSLLQHKALLTSAMFARKVDPTIYVDVFDAWDGWMKQKMLTQSAAPRQPAIAAAHIHGDPLLAGAVPAATPYELDTLVDEEYVGEDEFPFPATIGGYAQGASDSSGPGGHLTDGGSWDSGGSWSTNGSGSSSTLQPDTREEQPAHRNEAPGASTGGPRFDPATALCWLVGGLVAALVLALNAAALGRCLGVLRARMVGGGSRAKSDGLKDF